MTEILKLTPQVEKQYPEVDMPEDKDLLIHSSEMTFDKSNKNGEKKANKEDNIEGKKLLRKVWEKVLSKENKEDKKKREEAKEELRKKLENKAKEEELKKELEENASIKDDEERIKKAEKVLGRKLTDEQKKALIKAHSVGSGIKKALAAVLKYTFQEIAEKIKILDDEGFRSHEIWKLLKYRLVGDLPPETPHEGTASEGGAMEDDLLRMINESERTEEEKESLRRELREITGRGQEDEGVEGREQLRQEQSESGSDSDSEQLLSGREAAPQLPPEEQERLENAAIRSIERQKIDVNNIEQLARLIIQTDPELWGEKYPLLDTEGNINQANFLNWVRESIIWHHENDSDNPQLNFWNLIEVSTPYRNINLAQMLRQRGKFFRTSDGIDLDELREQITREVWLFNTSRNNNLQYIANMFSGEQLNGTLKQQFFINTFTKNAFGKSTLRWILTMPENFITTKAQQTQSEREGGKAGEGDAKVGEGVRTAYLTYYHLSDLDKLKDLLGEKAALLSRTEYESHIIRSEVNSVKAIYEAQGKDVREKDELEELGMSTDTEYLRAKQQRKEEVIRLIREQSDTAESKVIQTKWLGSSEGGSAYYLDDLFEKDGTIKKRAFIGFLNFFTGPETNSQTVSTVREMVRHTIRDLYDPEKKAEDPINDSVGGYFEMPQYAEQWAFSMLRWSGAAARNDTGARSYDKWTELQLTQYKRDRDSAESRLSGFGNPYNFELYKQLSPDLFNGIVLQDDKKTTPFELLEKLEKKRNEENEYNPHEELSRLEFTQNAMGQFAAVHLDNTFKLLEIITGAEELDFDKFIEYDRYGRMVFNEKDFQEDLKGFFKTWRNAYSTWGQINFATKVKKLKARSSTEYEEIPLAKAMFGDEILDVDEFKVKADDVREGEKVGEFSARLVNEDKEALWKQLVKGYIAAQIYAHRDLKSHYTHYDFGQIEGIFDVLERVPGGVIYGDEEEEIDESGNLVTRRRGRKITEIETKEGGFSKKDLEWIRKHSNTGKVKMYGVELLTNTAEGTVKGGFNALRSLVSEVFKS